MKYNPTNKGKYLVFNPTNQTLVEKLYSAISVFHLAVRNNMEFRINDTEGVKLVKYFTSVHQWWYTDWEDESHVKGVIKIKDNVDNLIKTNRIMNDVQHCDVIHVFSKGDFSDNIKLKPFTNKEVFDYLFAIESLYFKNYKYILNKISVDPPIIVNIDDMDIESATTFIGELINQGNKVFLSTFNIDLLNVLRSVHDKSVLKTISSNSLNIKDSELGEFEDELSTVFQILLLNDMSHKVISNSSLELLYVSLKERSTIMKYNKDLNLYEINQ